MREKGNKQLSWERISNSGLLVFGVIYLVSALLYPNGFIWTEHYWCDMLSANEVRIIAISGHFVLCLSLGLFFYRFALKLALSPKWKKIILNSGFLSVTSAFFIFTEWHDFFISFSSITGIPALLGIGLALRQNQVRHLLTVGVFCGSLFVLNNLVYYAGQGINYLPLLQKITIVSVLYWVFVANRHLIALQKSA